ncbi:MAG TPA: S8 family serine peptidase [Mycobacteriales bacterium]|nr:S8 family serine peptidase [Mycobacteriales bacterium]
MQRRYGSKAVVAVVALASTFGGTGAVAQARSAARPVVALPKAAPQAPVPASTVTLVTGDKVRLFSRPGGQPAVGIEPARGRERIGFLHETHAGPSGTDISVIPSDAVPLLAAGRLDPRLFDVSALVRQGFADTRPTLPLILEYGDAATARAAATRPAAPAATTVRALPSVHGTAVRQDRRRGADLWRWLTARSRAGAPSTALNAGVAKVWLDGVAHPTLDVSVPQIGAPTAWQAGFTGSGVTVGVLDTGIKADHPDLAGKVVEARDFTGTSPNATDDIGHGTHVAGIIAGTGAASNGRYRGVAPDAKLVSGKVCVQYGCPDSAVIAGMEWIAPKVRVVNMSLGGDSTDGTDPLSQAVNNLTAQYGTLFVVSAGNDRSIDIPDPTQGVTAPATADAALAVGSVTKQDQTSPFSPPGPRRGDNAVKPDIAAPGSDIVSDRAAGTPAGDANPVDANYARLSGTSMAAPHVAGAAAILAQQHQDWTAARLKPTLMSTAQPTASVFEQGAGRVDVARAVTQQVTATGGSLSYGFFAWPHEQRVTKTVTYRNDGAAAVTLSLSLAATGPDGGPAPAGLFTVSASRLTVPAHGTAKVGVTARPAAAGATAAGGYGGRLTASANGIAVQTALAAVLEPESYNLTVRLASRTGHLNSGLASAVNTQTGQAYGLRPFTADPAGRTGTAVVRLPKGSYDVNAIELDDDPANPARPLAVTLMSRPGLAVGRDTVVTLDATDARPVTTVVDRRDAALQFGELGLVSGNPAGDRTNTLSWLAGPGQRLFAAATRPVTDHTYAFFYRATLAAGTPGADPGAYVYHLAFLERGHIPVPIFVAHDRDLATVNAAYYTQGVPSQALRIDISRIAFPGAGSGVYQQYPHTLPSRRTELYTANPDVTWAHVLAIIAPDGSDNEINWSVRSYQPGRYSADWNRAPLGPAFGYGPDGWGVYRAGSQLAVLLNPVSGNDPEQFTQAPLGLTGTLTLSREGAVLGTSQTPDIGVFDIPDSPGTYVLRTTGVRVVPWSVIGTKVDVAWTFHDPGAAAPAVPLPLLVVRARGEVDAQDRAPADRPYTLSLLVQHQPGSTVSAVTDLRVEASFDDGATWTSVPTVRSGDGGTATLRNPAGNGFVSLRITAADAAGNAVTQTVTRAYQTAPAG